DAAAAGGAAGAGGRGGGQRHRPAAPGGGAGAAGRRPLYLYAGVPDGPLRRRARRRRDARLVRRQPAQALRAHGVPGRADAGAPVAGAGRGPLAMAEQQPFRLTLGSASPARRWLLERAGYRFDVRPADIDEPTHAGYPNPRRLVQHVAWLKADVVAPQLDGGVLLTADTVAWLDGRVLGKPADEADARRTLRFP